MEYRNNPSRCRLGLLFELSKIGLKNKITLFICIEPAINRNYSRLAEVIERRPFSFILSLLVVFGDFSTYELQAMSLDCILAGLRVSASDNAVY